MPAKKKTTAKKATAKKATAKKTAAKKATTRRAAAGKKVTKKTAKKAPARKKAMPALSPEERFRQIQEAAYFIAEESDWTRNPTECWVEAEKLITRLERA